MTSDDDKPLTPEQARQKLQKGLSDYLAGNDPKTIVFRLKRTKKASETYPLKLTQQQRETLLNYETVASTVLLPSPFRGSAGLLSPLRALLVRLLREMVTARAHGCRSRHNHCQDSDLQP